jgi:hypothetical protein
LALAPDRGGHPAIQARHVELTPNTPLVRGFKLRAMNITLAVIRCTGLLDRAPAPHHLGFRNFADQPVHPAAPLYYRK